MEHIDADKLAQLQREMLARKPEQGGAHAALAAGGAPGAAPMKATALAGVDEAEAKPDVTYARAPVASSGQGVAGRPHAVQKSYR